MYCIKCGREIPEGSNFCPDCGAPVEQTAPVRQVQASEPESQPVQQPAVQFESQQPAQPDEKKKLKLKLFIILGAAAATVIAAVLVFFLAIFPELTARRVNMGDYIKTTFNSDYYVNGHINGEVRLDLEKAYNELVSDKTKLSSYEFRSYFDSAFKYEFKKQSLKDTVTTAVTYKSKYLNIGDLEKRIGVRFNENAIAKVSVDAEIDSNNITVDEPVELDVFGVIDKCYYTKGLSNKGIGVCVESKSVKKDGYEFKVYGFDGSFGYSSGSVYIYKDNNSRGYVEFKTNKPKGNKDAKSKFTLSFTGDEDDKTLIKGTPFIVKKTEKEYTIKPQQCLTLKQAKSNLGKVRKKVRDLYSSSSYKTTINGTYLLTARDKNSSTADMVITLITKSSKSNKSKYYIAYILKNCYIDEREKKAADRFKYETSDSKYDYKNASKLWASLKKQYGKKYKIQKAG